MLGLSHFFELKPGQTCLAADSIRLLDIACTLARAEHSKFAAGETTKTVTVLVNGDTTVENDEAFFVNLSNAVGGSVIDGQGKGTINNDDVPPASLSINDISFAERNSGSRSRSFTVTLSTALSTSVTVSYATANGTATAGSDYAAKSGTITFAAGVTSRTISITVFGDRIVEGDETFFVNLSNAVGATISDSQGKATILNDDGNGGAGGAGGSDGVISSGTSNSSTYWQYLTGRELSDPSNDSAAPVLARIRRVRRLNSF